MGEGAMLNGSIEKFAIEAIVVERPKGWILGHFRFWINGKPVGDWDDTVDLKGCVEWLLDFVSNPKNRYEPGLDSKSAEDIFEIAYDPVIAGTVTVDDAELPIPDPFARFHISHLGMSSFEAFDILLLKNELGMERVLWRRAGETKIEECLLDPDTMESTALAFCSEFQSEMEA